MINGVFAMPKVKVLVQRQICALCKSARELPHFSNTTMSDAKEANIIKDESEGDDTEELYRSVSFHQNRGTYRPFASEQHFLPQKFDCILSSVRLKTDRFPKNLLTNLRGFILFQLCCKDRTERS